MKINALGFIETFGLVAAIEAADAMVKSANVRLIKQHTTNPGMITVVVEGDVAACRAAVDAGMAAANRVGKVIGRVEIPRPGEGIEQLLFDYLDNADDFGVKKSAPKIVAPAKEKVALAAKAKEAKEAKETKKALDIKIPEGTTKITNDELIAFIKISKKGRTFKELVAKFAGAKDLEAMISGLVEHKQIQFKQMRYSVKA